MFLPLGPWRRRKVSNNSIRYIDNTRLMCTHRPSQKRTTCNANCFCSSLLDIPSLFHVFPGRVLCSTVDVVRKTQNLAGPARAAAVSREREVGHHRPAMASTPARWNSPSPQSPGAACKPAQQHETDDRRGDEQSWPRRRRRRGQRACKTRGRHQRRPRQATAARRANGAAQGWVGRATERLSTHRWRAWARGNTEPSRKPATEGCATSVV